MNIATRTLKRKGEVIDIITTPATIVAIAIAKKMMKKIYSNFHNFDA